MFVLNLNITGSSTSSGKLRFVNSSADLISLDASSRFDPYSNSRVTTEILSIEVDLIFFKLVTELKPLSTFFVTLSSTSCALAPGYCVSTLITGGSISGNKSIGNLSNDTKPIIMIATNNIIVVIGRLTDSSGKFIIISLFYFSFNFNFASIFKQTLPLNNKKFPGR